MDTSAAAVGTDYHDTLRVGDRLEPFVLESESTVTFESSETPVGYDDVAETLQSGATDGWSLESSRRLGRERGAFATMAVSTAGRV